MKKSFYLVLLASSLVNINPAEAISVINFDDIDTGFPQTSGTALVPYQYQNFHWSSNGTTNSGFTAINDAIWTGAGNYNNNFTAPSAPNGVLNSGIVTVSRVGGGLFTFKEAYFAPFTSNSDFESQGSTAHTIIVRGFNGANLVGSANYTFTQAGYIQLTQDIPNITSLELIGTSPAVQNFETRWAMDNFSYEAAPVPLESDAAPIVGATAFFAMGVWWKRRLPLI
ncbi:MAG: hypothetical protein ACK5CA_06485 [Cyanobacteriota bacterium]|jgi:hypothetical protein